MKQQIAVIGGGAAGFFAAITCASAHPEATVHLFEKSSKCLAKVKISGGGRCNVTHACFEPRLLAKFYPRGSKQLKQAFGKFQPKDTQQWFEQRGVKLKTEPDGRMFPTTDDSQTIIDCLQKEARKTGVRIHLKSGVKSIKPSSNGWKLQVGTQEIHVTAAIIATGGSPKMSGMQWLEDLGMPVISPVPSLFTFNYPKDPIKSLMGVSIPHARVKLQGSKWVQEGPVLITHWGMSGPAILKLSAFAARWLAEKEYKFGVQIAWLPNQNEEQVREHYVQLRNAKVKKQLHNLSPEGIPQRMWEFLLEKAQIPRQKVALELSNKDINRLAQALTNDTYQAHGKTTFKEEFVTCGGIDLSAIDFKTMQSRHHQGLYFAGEVLNMDGVTGGFNFQAAWTTGYLAGLSAGQLLP